MAFSRRQISIHWVALGRMTEAAAHVQVLASASAVSSVIASASLYGARISDTQRVSRENFMKTIIAVLTFTFLSGGALAQAPSPSSASSTAMAAADAKRNAAVEKHIAALHGTLKITAAEESQWANVAQTMRGSAIELDKAIDKRAAIVDNATAVDNLKAYGEIAQAHVDSVKKLAAAFSPLYASMPDDQKKVADEVFAQRAHHKMK